jgi:hypothetical protein
MILTLFVAAGAVLLAVIGRTLLSRIRLLDQRLAV